MRVNSVVATVFGFATGSQASPSNVGSRVLCMIRTEACALRVTMSISITVRMEEEVSIVCNYAFRPFKMISSNGRIAYGNRGTGGRGSSFRLVVFYKFCSLPVRG